MPRVLFHETVDVDTGMTTNSPSIPESNPTFLILLNTITLSCQQQPASLPYHAIRLMSPERDARIAQNGKPALNDSPWKLLLPNM